MTCELWRKSHIGVIRMRRGRSCRRDSERLLRGIPGGRKKAIVKDKSGKQIEVLMWSRSIMQPHKHGHSLKRECKSSESLMILGKKQGCGSMWKS